MIPMIATLVSTFITPCIQVKYPRTKAAAAAFAARAVKSMFLIV
jgi:hypothetical protein